MNLKKSLFAIQENNIRDLDKTKDFPTTPDLIVEKKVSNDEGTTVHYRRDLDSIG